METPFIKIDVKIIECHFKVLNYFPGSNRILPFAVRDGLLLPFLGGKNT
jgi:hypothetical protein